MATEWSELDEITLYKACMQFRPLGLHEHVRLISIYMSLNPNLSSTPHISMLSLRQKLDDLYDMDYLKARIANSPNSANGNQSIGDDDDDEHDDEEEDGEKTIEIEPHEFELPYFEYHNLIEAQAGVHGSSRTVSPVSARDPRSSPTQSFKSESVVQDEEDVKDEQEDGEEAEAEEEEAEEEAEAEEVPVRGRGSRKRTATGAIKEPTKSSYPRSKRGSTAAAAATNTQESVASTPAPTDDESVSATATRGRKKTRAAPSRKSTRKR